MTWKLNIINNMNNVLNNFIWGKRKTMLYLAAVTRDLVFHVILLLLQYSCQVNAHQSTTLFYV